jgi:phosphoribosylformylglycinamidine synthase PurS subunit
MAAGMYKVSVYVTPKAAVVDPQGAVVQRALPALGHSGVGNIRVGRYITLEVPGDDPAKVEAAVDDMCRRLLANPIIEDYRFDVTPLESAGEGA